MSVLEITRRDHADKAWDRFVEQHSHATVAHLAAWGAVFEGAYRHERVYLVAEEAGEIAGVLPLVVIKSRVFGRRVVSMPFLDYGGILAEPDSEAERRLADAALGVAREHGAQSIGLRQLHPIGMPATTAGERVTMLLPLSSEEEVWKALPSERRNRVRKGEKQGLRAVWGGAELLDDFYRSFRNAGTFEFKRQWGALPHSLPWIFVDVVAGARPSVDRDASRYQRLIEAWKRLPVPIANVMGPLIRRQVPN